MKRAAHTPPTSSVSCLALSQAQSLSLSLFLSVSKSQFVQNEIVSCSSEFGFFFLFPTTS